MALQNKNKIRNVVICPDKFKGGLNSLSVASAIKEGLEDYFSHKVSFKTVEMADGGDGSAELFGKLTGGRKIDCRICGPLGEDIQSFYVMSGTVAFVECAKACGLAMVPEDRRNPLETTTFGVGQMIADALEKGAEEIFVGLGGSATNDCGTGMLQGLGFSLGLPSGVKASGGTLSQIKYIAEPSMEKLKKVKITIINDVDNPLCGPDGATYVYSPQKGANEKSMARMDKDMSDLVLRCGKTSLSKMEAKDAALLPGAGAAGGLGFAFMHFLGAGSISGFKFFGGLQGLEDAIAEADLVISGEGSIDSQSLWGKVVGGCCECLRRCKDVESKRLWLFCGKARLEVDELARACGGAKVGLYQLADIEQDMKARMKREYPLLRQLSYCAAMEMDALL